MYHFTESPREKLKDKSLISFEDLFHKEEDHLRNRGWVSCILVRTCGNIQRTRRSYLVHFHGIDFGDLRAYLRVSTRPSRWNADQNVSDVYTPPPALKNSFFLAQEEDHVTCKERESS
jgi:hypothetical protein